MPVTDKQAATLHAYLAGRTEEHDRLYAELTREEVGYEFSALLAAAVFEAIGRRFIKGEEIASDQDVVKFVADLRSRTSATAAVLDPTVAERLICHSLGRGDVDDIDDKTVFGAQFILLAGLIVDEEFTEDELESFIATARSIADDWIARDR
ncbi:hypothetical protein [Actinomadura sp. WMMA1423]|uniref:hypothetical protein n=1 Tax=Actinomadura sp. WMMA1423 TaxID=2591108 RepID=UPI00114681E8|nr:hypothetical protein [Actinomadura sp. WMMA1423]